jgi:hypothetical protein
VRGEVLEGARGLADVEIVRIGESAIVAGLALEAVKGHELAGGGTGYARPQQQAVNQGEKPGVHANAEGKDGNRREGEAAVPGEHAQTETNVLPQGLHGVSRFRLEAEFPFTNTAGRAIRSTSARRP